MDETRERTDSYLQLKDQDPGCPAELHHGVDPRYSAQWLPGNRDGYQQWIPGCAFQTKILGCRAFERPGHGQQE